MVISNLSDIEWFEKVYTSTYDKLYKQLAVTSIVAMNRILKKELEDCLQETYLALWENREKVKEYENVYGWLVVVGERRLIDCIRTIRPYEYIDIDVQTVCDYAPSRKLEDAYTDALEKIKEVLEPNKYELIYNYYVKSDSRETLAAHYGTSPATLRKRVERVIKHIREHFLQ